MLADVDIHRAEFPEALFHLGVDFPQCGSELRHADGLEQIGDDAVFNRPLRIFEIVVAGKKGNGNQRLDLPDALRQLRPGYERHLDIRQQQVRLQLLHKLQSVQPVARAADKAKPDLLPADHAAYRLSQLRLIVGNDDGIGFFGHFDPSSLSVPDYTGVRRICKERKCAACNLARFALY